MTIEDEIYGSSITIANNLIALSRSYKKILKHKLKIKFGKGPYTKVQFEEILNSMCLECSIINLMRYSLEKYFSDTGIKFISESLEALARNSKIVEELYEE